MGEDSVFYDRQKLYDEVWTDPVTTVAKRYGVTDVAIHKVCTRLSIPVPPRGYWAKLKAGKPVERTPLPPTGGPAKAHRFARPREPEAAGDAVTRATPLSFLDDEERTRVLAICNSIEVKDLLAKPHPLIAHDQDAREEQKRCERESHRLYSSFALGTEPSPSRKPITGLLDIRVQDDQLQRTYRLLDAMFHTVETLGGSVRVRERTTVSFFQEPVKIRVTSKGKLLTLTIDEYDAPRKNWHDTPRKQVENAVGAFIIGIYECAHRIRARREERVREEQRQQAEARRRHDMVKRQRREMARYTALESAALDWQKARALEGYVAELERQALGEADIERRSVLMERVQWARGKVAWLDPLVAAEDAILGRRRHDQPEGEKVLLEDDDELAWMYDDSDEDEE